MAGILCAWANLPDEAMDWYLNDYVPGNCTREPNHLHVLHAEQIENGMDDGPGKLDSPWDLFTVYEVRDIFAATQSMYDKKNHPPDTLAPGPLKHARFDVRTYREVNRWQQEDWDGDVSDICSVSCMEWSILPGMEDKVLEFYCSQVGPLFIGSPEVLRFRLFEIENATVWHNDSYVTKERKDLRKFFTFVEVEGEQWPWAEVLELSEMKLWQEYFEPQQIVQWQASMYLVKQTFPVKESKKDGKKEEQPAESKAES